MVFSFPFSPLFLLSDVSCAAMTATTLDHKGEDGTPGLAGNELDGIWEPGKCGELCSIPALKGPLLGSNLRDE